MELSFTHVGITVSDLEASVKFYEEVFGFNCSNRVTFDEKFLAQAPDLYKLTGTMAKVAFMVSPNGIVLEMFQFIPDQPDNGLFAWNRPGYTHICITLEDLHEFSKHMHAKNVHFCMDVLERWDGGHWVFVQDPDGNLIEVNEPMRRNSNDHH